MRNTHRLGVSRMLIQDTDLLSATAALGPMRWVTISDS